MQVVRLVQEIIIVFGIEIILSPGLSAKRFAVADLLKVVQSAGNAFVPVGVEGIQIDAGSAVHAGIYFGTVDDLLSVCVYNTGRCGRVGVDEIGVGVDWIIGSFQVAVTERSLQGGQCRDGFAVAFQFALAFFISCLDGGLDLVDGRGIRFRNDEARRTIWCLRL